MLIGLFKADKSGDKFWLGGQVGDKLETSLETSFYFKGKTCLKLVSSGLQHVPETCLQLVPGERPGLGIEQGKTNLLSGLLPPIRKKNILTLMEPSTAFPHRGPGVERTQEPQSYTVPRIRVPGCCAACNCSAVALGFLEVPGREIHGAG